MKRVSNPAVGIAQSPVAVSPTRNDGGLENLITLAKQDLSQRLSMSDSEINLVEAKPVVWPDASLGCPQPGMRYKQVPEDGALIVLEVLGIVYQYHSGGSRGLFLCEKLQSMPKKTEQIDITSLMTETPGKNLPPVSTSENGSLTAEDE